MREKYVEERFSRWFVFGESATTVDLASTHQDTIFDRISPETAAQLIAARDAYIDSLVAVFTKDPEALFRLKGRREVIE